ncbi:MAG: hypothetical protein DME42_11280 [Verrucomicrobia bacterium]|nr:MAG: hypothetical protein DME42_11280 [Verrucomicrobiota bacterium]
MSNALDLSFRYVGWQPRNRDALLYLRAEFRLRRLTSSRYFVRTTWARLSGRALLFLRGLIFIADLSGC